MRSPAEIGFRLKQEAANIRMFVRPPRAPGDLPDPLVLDLPDPVPVATALRGTAGADELVALAEDILAHRFPILGYRLDLGAHIRWRRDPVQAIETPPVYFRRIKYLDPRRSGDHKVVWELNRHQHLVTLAQAWRLTGRGEFVEEIRAQIDSWFDQNPYGCGINWASALEAGFRLLSWIWVYHLAAERLGPQFRQRLRNGIYQHACYIERNLSHYWSPNTHLLGEGLALFAAGKLFPEMPRASVWKREGGRVLERQMERQIRPDGSYFEQSTYYHVYALDMFLFYALMEPTPSSFRERLRKAAHYLWVLLGPGGFIPFLGDDDGGRLFHPFGERSRFGRATLAACSAWFNELAWPCSRDDLMPLAAWWLGAGVLPKARSGWTAWQGAERFPDAGVVAVSTHEAQTIVDTRAFGWGNAGHGHAHALSFVYRNADREILIDPGTFAYSDPEWRDRFRGTAAHNTVRVDSRDQADPAGPFAWKNLPATRILEFRDSFLAAECRYRGVIHTRKFHWLAGGRILIVDHIDGPPGEHEIEQIWRLQEAGDRATLTVSEPSEQSEGWFSTVYGRKDVAPVVCVRRRGNLPMVLEAELGWGGQVARKPAWGRLP